MGHLRSPKSTDSILVNEVAPAGNLADFSGLRGWRTLNEDTPARVPWAVRCADFRNSTGIPLDQYGLRSRTCPASRKVVCYRKCDPRSQSTTAQPKLVETISKRQPDSH